MAPLSPLVFSILALHSLAARVTRLGGQLAANGSDASALGPEDGSCAVHSFDNYKPPSSTVCYVRLYKCADESERFSIKDSNTGDIAWALASKCHKYGKYLHIWRVEVAQSAMKDGRGKYKQCNRSAKWGKLCGCGLTVDDEQKLAKQCPPPDPAAWGPTAFGWRTKSFETGTVYQFSTPHRAMGDIDEAQAEKFVQSKGHRKHSPSDTDAPFQWRQAKKERVIDINACLKKHVLTGSGGLDEMIERFRTAVFRKKAVAPGCEDIKDP
mmetsp:Transcript_111053/g.344421  ORF Transcript_111053/g.344421 Transcript_111053/m.344421 type:complete len:268 (+) Transcript_111053:32-835(+)